LVKIIESVCDANGLYDAEPRIGLIAFARSSTSRTSLPLRSFTCRKCRCPSGSADTAGGVRDDDQEARHPGATG